MLGKRTKSICRREATREMLKMNDNKKWFKKDINVGTEKEKEVDESKY